MNLPIESHEQKLERRSIDKLRILFHETEKFIVRSERGYDYGVDCDIELLDNDNNPTNINFHAQVKAIDKLENKSRNKDGSYSIQISTSNVNYLLNSIKSIYILYVKSEDSFYFYWADDLLLQLNKKDNYWHLKDGHPVIRFYDKINKDSINSIYNIVFETGKINRKINEKLIGISSSIRPTSGKIIIDIENLDVLSEKEIIEAIESTGFNYINRGKSKELVGLSEKLTKGIELSPIVCLILGFSSYNVGRIYDALSYIHKAKVNEELLNNFDKAYLRFIEADIKKSKGMISAEDYEIAIANIREVESVKLYYELMKTREKFLLDPEEGVIETRSFVNKIELNPAKHIGIYLQAKTDLLKAEGWLNNYIWIKKIGEINAIEEVIGINQDLRLESIHMQLNLNKKWEDLRSTLEDEIKNYGNYLILSNYCQIYVDAALKNYITRLLVKVEKQIPELIIEETNHDKNLEGLHYFIDQSIKIYREFDHNYNLCVSLSTQFELFEFQGKLAEGRKVINEIYKIAKLYDFDDIIKKTKNLENNGSFYKGLLDSLNQKKEGILELKKREDAALKILMDTDEEERHLNITHTNDFYDECMVIDIFKVGFFNIHKERIGEFFEILGIENNSEVAKQIKFMGFEFEPRLIPRLNISPEIITSEGYGEGNYSIKSIEDLERVASRRRNLFDAGFYKQEPHY